MAFDYLRIVELRDLPQDTDPDITLYVNPDPRRTYIRLISLYNAHTAPVTVILYKVPDNAGAVGTEADENIFYREQLPAGAVRIVEYAAPGLIMLDANETIKGSKDNAAVVTIEITGGAE